MLVFLEGIDKSGKSTFAQGLSELTNIPVFRKSTPRDLRTSDRHSYFKGVAFALADLHRVLRFHLLVDRSFISDWVYSNSNSANVPISIWEEWERTVGPNNAIVIYLEVSFPVFYSRISNDPDPYMSAEDYWSFVRLYDEYLEFTSFEVCRVSGHAPLDIQLEQMQSALSEGTDIAFSTEALHLLGGH